MACSSAEMDVKNDKGPYSEIVTAVCELKVLANQDVNNLKNTFIEKLVSQSILRKDYPGDRLHALTLGLLKESCSIGDDIAPSALKNLGSATCRAIEVDAPA